MFSDQDKALIQELNLQDIPEEQQAIQLEKFYKTLQKRIGMALEEKLSDEQLEAFGKVIDAGDNTAAEDWLRSEVPDYEQLTAAEMSALKQEITQSAAELRNIIDEAAK